ncbi:metallophosphoesterase [Spirosoma sp. SC4-14]|uniref:metallophosphoesterase n=1 Tax=Spirosoma sp. SC4-14 TaxID=3128900 RepID=UPI0030D4C8B1
MKLVTISDLHGRTMWKDLNVNDYDQVIFLGDYTDSYVVDDDTIYTNLSDIIGLKRLYSDKVILLIGNHDAQYIHYPNYRCSGFRTWAQAELTALFAQNQDLFQIAHQHNAYLFTHAGITNQWLARLLAKTNHTMETITPTYDLAGLINSIHQQPLQSILFEVSPKRGGSDSFGGPVWADRSETRVDYLTNFHQIVGHTPTDQFLTIGNTRSSITYTDILQTRTAFYEVEIPD